MGWREEAEEKQKQREKEESDKLFEYQRKLKERKTNYSNAIYPGDGCRRKKRG